MDIKGISTADIVEELLRRRKIRMKEDAKEKFLRCAVHAGAGILITAYGLIALKICSFYYEIMNGWTSAITFMFLSFASMMILGFITEKITKILKEID